MSTKIYNGFKMQKLDLETFNNFYLDLNKACMEIAHEKYVKFCLSEIIDYVDRLSFLDHNLKNDPETYLTQIEQTLKYNYNSSIHISNLRTKILLEDISSEDNMKINKVKDSNLCFNLIDIINQEIIEKDICNERDYDFDYEFEMCVFPRTDDTLLLVYGDTLIDAFNQYVDKKEGNKLNDILAKYEVQYYGYWDNTDPPKSFTKEDWKARGDEWEKALEIGNGIPNKSGITLNLYKYDYDLNVLLFKDEYEKYLEQMLSVEERANRNAELMVLEEYIINNKPEGELTGSVFSRLNRKFNKELTENVELQNAVANKAKELMSIYPEIDKNIINKNVKEFIPNYEAYKQIDRSNRNNNEAR